MLPKLKVMIGAERARKEQIRREERRRNRSLEFARIYLGRGVPANQPEDGPFTMPSWGEFEDDPQVRALLAEDDYTIPFTEDRYGEIEDMIAKAVIKFNIRVRRDLAQMHGLSLPPGESEEEADENIVKPFLDKATTVFHISWSAGCKCMPYKKLSEIVHLSFVSLAPERGPPPNWSTVLLGIEPDIMAGKIACELLRAAGASENSTWEQIEGDYGKKLVCTCRKPNFEQPALIINLVSVVPRLGG